jgi:acyl-CoA synthetase (NDP forming)
MKVDDVLTHEWQTIEELMKKTKSGKPSVVSRLNKLYNNWQAIEKMRKNGIMYYRLIKK